MSERVLIVNADDFGASDGVNRGVVEAHAHGIVTSTSLMVRGAAAADAAQLAEQHPQLGIGLHWDLDAGGRPIVDYSDAAAVRAELSRQLEAFQELIGSPTHADSHHHIHRLPAVAPIASEIAGSLGLPMRDDARVKYIGGFYGQWELGVTELEHISPEFLIWLLRNELAEGWTEIGCHPGYIGGGFQSSYLSEREVELRTLTSASVRAEIEALGIRLATYAELGQGA